MYRIFICALIGLGLMPVLVHGVTNDTMIKLHEVSATNTTSNVERQVKLPFSNYSESLPVLLLYSIPESNSHLRSINALVHIIESHWNVDITAQKYTEVPYSEIVSYSHVIFIELNANTDAIDLFATVTKHTELRTYWIGFDKSSFTALNQFQPEQIHYKGETFKIDDFFRITGTLDTNNSDFYPLVSFSENNKQQIPYIGIYNTKDIRALATLPTTYNINTYSLPFLDSFHYFFEHHGRSSNQLTALLRLEDVNVYTYQSGRTLRQVNRFLTSRDIPFHIALIPRYINSEAGIDMVSQDSIKFNATIKQMLAPHGNGILIQHGYTHQVDDQISGLGYEFWDAQNNQPLKFTSEQAASLYPLRRIDDAQAAMVAADLPIPDIWETPHYAQSNVDNEAINHRYRIRYEHIPQIGSLPFAAKINGVIYIPENLGYITDTEQPSDKTVLLNKLLTFEDPVASVFWHPWRDQSELIAMIDILEERGFVFNSAYSLLEGNQKPAGSSSIGYGVIFTDIVIYLVFFAFILGALIYARNVWLVRKYLRQILAYKITLTEVLAFSRSNNIDLPQLGLFVPARNEGLVIGNTLRRIAKIDYPKEKLNVFVIVDERELDDDVVRTTKQVAMETLVRLHAEYGTSFITIVEVPKWYSGVFGDNTHTFGKSTKGRALNYCLQSITATHIDMIGILDADGRLHPNVLKEVAIKRMRDQAKLLQGPVFQVGNFNDVSIVGRAAGLELALHHLTELPSKLNKGNTLQFLAGTNYFIDTQCITQAGGWDQTALVEDAEIALRLYAKYKIVGSWLNSPEIEQTPPTFAVYRKQRHRWVRGHIDLIKQIRISGLSKLEKLRLYNKILFSQMRFIFDVGLPILSIYLMIAGSYRYIHPFFNYVSVVLLVASICIWDTYGFMYRSLKMYIDTDMSLKQQMTKSFAHLLFMPVFIIIQAVPRFTALFSYIFRKNQNTWYKTERTAEAIIH